MSSTEYSDIFRRKTRKELILVSSIVCGIEFCYSAETAFVTPTLLTAGLPIDSTSIIWCLSPLIGFFVSPILGSLSDACKSLYGRRRPFIILYSIGILIGLVLVPNGEYISQLFAKDSHSLSVSLTILGAVLLDFCCDACQSPSRALLFEVTVNEDHAKGLSTFTLMAGFGGAVGYLIGGLDWENWSIIVEMFGTDHKRIVFLLCSIAFVICSILTITSYEEIPLCLLTSQDSDKNFNYQQLSEESYEMTQLFKANTERSGNRTDSIALSMSPTNSFSDYIYSIVQMPDCLRILCLTNLLSWMSLICYSLYFTDFIAESVFGGDPTASPDSKSFQLYESGVKFGCICMTFYSLSCSFYSYFFQNLIKIFGEKVVYVGSALIYSFGMFMIGVTRNRVSALVFSLSAGIQYSTLFTMPYSLIARYQTNKSFLDEGTPRGLGTDIAVVGSMVFLAQFILSLCMGSIIEWFQTKSVTVFMASVLSVGSAYFAAKVHYIQE